MAVHSLSAYRSPARSSRVRGPVIVFAAWIVASALTAVLAFGVITPGRFVDEFLYRALADSLADGAG